MIYPHLRPIIVPTDNGLYKLYSDFEYTCPKYNVSVYVEAPFIFDGASIPKPLWSIIGSPFLPRYIGPALVHDNLYRYARDKYGKIVNRRLSDKVFAHALKLNEVRRKKRFILYYGLRNLGMFSWRKHRRRGR